MVEVFVPCGFDDIGIGPDESDKKAQLSRGETMILRQFDMRFQPEEKGVRP